MMNITSKAASIVSDTQRMNSLYKSQAIIEFTPDGIVLDANQNFLDCMGYSLKSIQGKHHSMFMPADQTKTADYRDFWAALARGSFVRGEFHRISQSGNDVWLQASYNPVIDRSGKVRSVLKIASDITDKKQEAVDNAGQIDAINRSQAVIHFEID